MPVTGPRAPVERSRAAPPDGDRLDAWERAPRALFVALLALTAVVAVPFALFIALRDALRPKPAGSRRYVEQTLS